MAEEESFLNMYAPESYEAAEIDDSIRHLFQGLDLNSRVSSEPTFVPLNEDDALEQAAWKPIPLRFNLKWPGSEEDGVRDTRIPFSIVAKKMMDLVPNGKLKKRVLTEGIGERVPVGALVWYQYQSFLEFSDVPVASSYVWNKAVELRLNSKNSFYALDVALSSMKRKETAEFLFHPDYTCEKIGALTMPPDAQILMKVELEDFIDDTVAMRLRKLSEEELKSTPFDEIYVGALQSLNSGNRKFSKEKFKSAIKRYKNSLRILESCERKTKKDFDKCKKLKSLLHTNLTVCYNKINSPHQAILQGELALHVLPNSPKLLFQLGLAHLNVNDLKEATKYALLARKHAPGDYDIGMLLQRIDKELSLQEDFVKAASGQAGSSMQNPHDDLDAEFQKEVRSYLEEFLQDPSVTELPLPCGLTKEEEMFFCSQAIRFGLFKEMKWDYGNTQLFFYKRRY